MPESNPRQPSRRPSQVEQRTSPGTSDQSPNVTPRTLLLGLAFLGLLVAGLWWANSRPAKPQPAPIPNQTTRTPAQNLAILSGKPADDPATAATLARLDALCPENDAQVADLLVNL